MDPGFWKTSEGRKHSLTLSPCRCQAPPAPPLTLRLFKQATHPQKTAKPIVETPVRVLLVSALSLLRPLPAWLDLSQTSSQQVAAQRPAWTWPSSRRSLVETSIMPMTSKATRPRACPWLRARAQMSAPAPARPPARPPASPQGQAWGCR